MMKKKFEEEEGEMLSGGDTKASILHVMILRNNKDNEKTTENNKKEFTVLIQTDKTTNYHQAIAKKLFPKLKDARSGKTKIGKVDDKDLYYYMLLKDN